MYLSRAKALIFLVLFLVAGLLAASPSPAAAPSWPSPLEHLRVAQGPGPGGLTFKWDSEGKNTSYFLLETATTPWKKGARDYHRYKISKSARSFTLDRAALTEAGAGVGTGWTLVWRFHAVHKTASGVTKRYGGQGQVLTKGDPAAGTTRIRVASYNVRVDDTWPKRAPLVIGNIKAYHPGIVTLQELYPSLVDRFQTELKRQLPSYRLTRTANLKTGEKNEQHYQSRLLYDTDRYALVSNCPEDRPSCYLTWEGHDGPEHSSYAVFEDLATGKRFFVASYHLQAGESYDRLRYEEMQSLLAQTEELNSEDLPVILGGDSNSSQLRTGPLPHDLLMEKGYYDSASTQKIVGWRYGTFNGYEKLTPSPFGVSPRIDVIATLGMPGSDYFKNVTVAKDEPFPSDHDMIFTDLKLP